MKSQMIKTIRKSDGNIAVSGRDLHKFLEIKTPFRKWVKRMIRDYGFIRGTDYMMADKNVRHSIGYNRRINVVFTLDCAKEICMVQKNSLGQLARRYFIHVQKCYQHNVPVLKTPEQRLRYFTVNTSQSIEDLDGRVSNLENNQKIGPSDYGYIGKAVGHKVYGYEHNHHLLLTNKERSKLYKDINGGVKKITGARCRSQLKAKDFNKVCKYIDNWIPSTATLTIIQSMKDGE